MNKIGKNLIDQILHRNCVEGMKMLPDACIPMIMTSPPYGDGGLDLDWAAATAKVLDVPRHLFDLGFEILRPPGNPE